MSRKRSLGRKNHGFANKRFAHTQRRQLNVLQVDLDRQAGRTFFFLAGHRLAKNFHLRGSYPACPKHPGEECAAAPVRLGVGNPSINAFAVRKGNRCNARRSRPHAADAFDFDATLIIRGRFRDHAGKQIQSRSCCRQQSGDHDRQQQQKHKPRSNPSEDGFSFPEHVRSVLHSGLYGHPVRRQNAWPIPA